MANVKKFKLGEATLNVKDGVSTITIAGLTIHLDEAITKDQLLTALGLGAAIHFIGTSTTDPKGSSGATVAGYTAWKKGDVVLYGQKEYILTGDTNVAANWTILGDEGSFALKTITVTGTGALEGGGTLEQNRQITHKAYDAIDAKGTNKVVTSVKSDGYGHLTEGGTGSLATTTVKGVVDSVTTHDTPELNKESVGSASGWDAGTMFSASYNETDEMLVLTPGQAPSLTVTEKEVGTSLTAGSEVTVPVAAASATTVATGSIQSD